MTRRPYIVGLTLIVVGLLIFSTILARGDSLRPTSKVNVSNIKTLMTEQVDIGPRYPGSNGSLQFKDWVLSKISSDWNITIQTFTYLNITIRNYFITAAHSTTWPKYLIGAHYDSRKVATNDPVDTSLPVPAANDGASGVAAILEMMNHIPAVNRSDMGFILFDAEDQGSGGMAGWPWLVGSTHFANQMTAEQVNSTKFFVLFDMIANDNLILKYEGLSDKALNEAIWDTAHNLGYSSIFVKQSGYSVTDDHVPFKKRGIRVVDLLDLSYPEWHTSEDDMAHVSPENAAIVVDVVLFWITETYWNSEVSSSSLMTSLNSSTNLSLIFGITPMVVGFITIFVYASKKQ